MEVIDWIDEKETVVELFVVIHEIMRESNPISIHEGIKGALNDISGEGREVPSPFSS